jgi:hypothetical protein
MDFKWATGICVGDPLVTDSTGKHFFMIVTNDSGSTWKEMKRSIRSDNDAIFAASGSNILLPVKLDMKYIFITGGETSRLIGEWTMQHGFELQPIPIMQGTASTGAFSFCIWQKTIYITGGDYIKYEKDSSNVVFTSDYGKTWNRSSVHGYRSCIIQSGKNTFITCGTNGVDISCDGCKTWQLIHGDGAKGTDGFNVCAKSKTGKAVYFAGTGRIGKLVP